MVTFVVGAKTNDKTYFGYISNSMLLDSVCTLSDTTNRNGPDGIHTIIA